MSFFSPKPPKSEVHWYRMTFHIDGSPPVVREMSFDRWDNGLEWKPGGLARYCVERVACREGIWEHGIFYPYHQIKLVEMEEIDAPA